MASTTSVPSAYLPAHTSALPTSTSPLPAPAQYATQVSAAALSSPPSPSPLPPPTPAAHPPSGPWPPPPLRPRPTPSALPLARTGDAGQAPAGIDDILMLSCGHVPVLSMTMMLLMRHVCCLPFHPPQCKEPSRLWPILQQLQLQHASTPCVDGWCGSHHPHPHATKPPVPSHAPGQHSHYRGGPHRGQQRHSGPRRTHVKKAPSGRHRSCGRSACGASPHSAMLRAPGIQ